MRRFGLISGLVALGGGAMLAGGCGGSVAPPADAYVAGDTGPAVDGGNDAASTPDTGLDSGPSPDTGMDAAVPATARTTPTNGSAIVLASDDSVLVACNRQAGSVSIFSVDTSTSPPTLGTPTEIAFPGDEPWAAVISNDDQTAYVILRQAQQIVRITDLGGTPTLDTTTHGTTGSEPTGIAISPLGATLWVANWGEGTLSRFSATDLSALGSVDLNAELVASGSLGTVTARPGLAHPRAITITNNLDTNDADESVYVTEYFAQTRTDTLPTDDSRFDVERRGLVYRVDATGTAQGTIEIAPVADTGFVDANAATTGCYPNQLLAAAIAPMTTRLYVTAVCASPRGPVGPVLDATGALTNPANFKTEVHTGLFVIDTGTNLEVPAQHVLLTQAFQARYTAMSTPDDGVNRRIPLIANDIAFVASGTVAYVPSYGSDAVFRARFNADGSLFEVGSATLSSFINLSPSGTLVGRLPYGLTIGHTTAGSSFAFTINEHSRNVSIISLASQTTVAAVQSTPAPSPGPEANVLDGRRFFVTGLGRWSFRGQGWNSCEACHGDGLTDTVTWYFARGPRQSISLDSTFDSVDSSQQRLLNWGAIFDEVHDFENNTRGNSGGIGAVVQAASSPPVLADRIIFDGSMLQAGQVASTHSDVGLNGSVSTELMPGGSDTVHSAIADWDRVNAYIQSIRSPRRPTTLVATDVTAGAALFAANNCAACHGTSMWTISRRFWTPDEAHNAAAGSLRTTSYTAPALFPASLNPPSAASGRTAFLRLVGGTAATDQIQCILRAVGTFPASGTTPIVPTGSTVVLNEVRQDMTTAAQGTTGFNPPSLLDSVASAPYFHGGNARTLEEVFDTTFAAHHTALSANFLETDTAALRATHVQQLVAFLLSIDESTTAPVDAVLTYDPHLCPATLP